MNVAEERQRWAIQLGLGAVLVWMASVVDVRPGALLDERGLANASDLFDGFLAPDLGSDFLTRVAGLTADSLAVGALAMLLALAVAVPLALLAARVPVLADAVSSPSRASSAWRAAGHVSRWILAATRSIPEIIWAFLFVRLLGLGPGPAVLAIGLTFGGILGKLFAELIEAVDPAPVRSLQASGVGRMGILAYGVWPQVRAQWIGYAVFRFECALRSAAILGIVGAGGLGQEIELSVRYFQYDKLAAALYVLLGCVVALEWASVGLRRIGARANVGLLAFGGVLAFLRLEIPWGQLWTAHAREQGGLFLARFATPSMESGFVGECLGLMASTLAMAVVGTAAAALLAHLLAPFATRFLAWRGYLPDPPSRSPWSRVGGRVMSGVARAVFQCARAMPELVWALVFVVWVGPGMFAGVLAIAAHTTGVLGRLFSEVYEEVERDAPRNLESMGSGAAGIWAFGVLPQVWPRIAAFSLFRFEVNVRATATLGFVGAGGIGDAIHTAISLFHMDRLATLLAVLFATVIAVDFLGGWLRRRLIRRQ